MELGYKIRKLRQAKGMSIEKLSELTGLSTGLISQIERDITGPSVASLWEIAKSLEVPINYFFDEYEKKDPIVRKDSRKKLNIPNSNITYELLCPDLTKKMESLMVEIQPGQCSNDELIGHEGEECGYIIQGTLKVKWGNKEYILNEGDSIYFDSTVPHRFVNLGEDVSISIWTMTPASF